MELFVIHQQLLLEPSKRYRRNMLLILRQLSMQYSAVVMKLGIMMPSVKCLEQKLFGAVLDKFFSGERDENTIKLLKKKK